MSTNVRATSVIRHAAVMSMCLAGCRDPAVVDLSHATRKRPRPADLVGTYVPDEDTRELISKGGYPAKTTFIELDADGALKVANIPDWWQLPPDVHQTGFDSGSGKWELYRLDPLRDQERWGLMFDFPSMKNFDSDRWHAEASGRPEDSPDVGLRRPAVLVGEHPYIIELAISRRGFKGVMRFKKVTTGAGNR